MWGLFSVDGVVVGTQLPRTGGIVQRAPYDIIGKPDKMKAQTGGITGAA